MRARPDDSPLSFEIEPAVAGDTPLLAAMSRRLIEFGLPWRYTARRLHGQLGESDTSVLVARSEGRAIGFAVMEFHFLDHTAHLVLLAVEPSARRRGVARALLAWLDAIALRGGIRVIRLEVRRRSGGAREFYRHLGYVEGERLRGYYDGREDAVRMERRLDA